MMPQWLQIRALIKELHSHDTEKRQPAMDELAKLGEPAIRPLIRSMAADRNEGGTVEGANEDSICFEAKVLKRINRPGISIPLLLKALKRCNRRGKFIFAIRFRTKKRRQEGMPIRDAEVGQHGRVRVILALGVLGDQRAVQPLVELLSDENWWVRNAATMAVGNLKAKEAVPRLIFLLNHDKESVMRNAGRSLGRIGDEAAIPHLLAAFENKRFFDWSAAAILNFGPQIIEPLIGLLGHKEPDVRIKAACVLAKSNDPRSVEPFLKILCQYPESQDMRSALDEFGPACTENLSKILLHHPDKEMRAAAASAILNSGTRLEGERKTAAPLTHETTAALIAALNGDPSSDVRAVVVCALARSGSKEAMFALITALTDDRSESVRAAAANWLRNFDADESTAALIAALKDRSEQVRNKAAYSLASKGSPEALLPIAQAYAAGRIGYGTAAGAMNYLEDAIQGHNVHTGIVTPSQRPPDLQRIVPPALSRMAGLR